MTYDLNALKDALSKMTPGEWRASEIDQGVQIYNSAFTYIGETRDLHGNDAAGIVALVNAAPALIADHQALQARVAELEAEAARLRETLGWYADPANYRTFHDEDGDESIPCIPCDLTPADEEGVRLSFYDCGDRARAALGEQP